MISQLHDQGLAIKQLDIVFESFIVNGISYAIPAWGGFITAELHGIVNSVLQRAIRCGFCNELTSRVQIMEVANSRFFTAI